MNSSSIDSRIVPPSTQPPMESANEYDDVANLLVVNGHHNGESDQYFDNETIANGNVDLDNNLDTKSSQEPVSTVFEPNGDATEITNNNNGPLTAPSVLQYFDYEDGDGESDESTRTEIEVECHLPPNSTDPSFDCDANSDEVATLRRPKECKLSNASTTTQLSTFSVACSNMDTKNNNNTTSRSNNSHHTRHNIIVSSNGRVRLNGSLSASEQAELGELYRGKGEIDLDTLKPNHVITSSDNAEPKSLASSLAGPLSGGQYVSCTNPFYTDVPDHTITTSSSAHHASKSKLNTSTVNGGSTVAVSSMISSDTFGGSPPTQASNMSLNDSSETLMPSNASSDLNLLPQHCPMEVPYAILTNKENSCPFFERRIALMVPVKVGRAIARVRPAPDNAVFDCKVLSRNHALLWYQDGKFFLRDTCSSNGTFINSLRLSSANEKSTPHELSSGDCVQFGVEVTEKKQVHSCVIATIRLFFPDGSEARGPSSMGSEYGLDDYHHPKPPLYGQGSYLSSSLNITPSQLIELSHFIKDAVHKQTLLEGQLESMRQVMTAAMDAAKNGWNMLVEEDRLLSRIEAMQAKVEVLLLAKVSAENDIPEEVSLNALKNEMIQLISDKEKLEISSKNSLANALEEKMTALANLHSVEMELQQKEDECRSLTTELSQNMKEMQNLVNACDKARKDVEELVGKLRQNEEDQLKSSAKFDRERMELQEKITFLEQASSEYRSLSYSQANTCDFSVQTDLVIDSSASSAEQQNQNNSSETSREESDVSTAIEKTTLQSDTDSSQSIVDTTSTNLLQGNEDPQIALLKQYEEQLSKAKHWLADTSVQYRRFYTATMTRLVSIDSLLSEKESLITQLNERIAQISNQLAADKQRHREQLDQMNLLLESEHEDNLRLANDLRTNEELIDRQNEEIEKFKCDIDMLRSGQELEQGKQKTKAHSGHAETQTEGEAPEGAAQGDAIKTIDDSNNGENIDLASTQQSLERLMQILNKIGVDAPDGEIPEEDKQNLDLYQGIVDKLNRVTNLNQQLKTQNTELSSELASVKERFSLLSYQNELSFCMALFPLIIIFLAVICAFYPILSYLMGTSGV